MKVLPSDNFSPGLPASIIWIASVVVGLTSIRAETIQLPAGSDWQAIVDASAPGTTYEIPAGVHRCVSIVPKDGDRIVGLPGSLLDGTVELTEWSIDGGGRWVHAYGPGLPTAIGAGCADPACAQPEDLYFDGERLTAVLSQSALVSANQWFFDKVNGRVYLLRNPEFATVEIGGPCAVAIDGRPPGDAIRSAVRIENVRVSRYPSAPQSGAIRMGMDFVFVGGLVEDCHGYGLSLWHGAVVRDSGFFRNGQAAMGGVGTGAVIERCEIGFNVSRLFAGVAWDSGGVKISSSSGAVFRQCYVHDNAGPGIWTDIHSNGMVVEDCIIEDNDWEGVLLELSSHQIVRRNVLRGNGRRYRGASSGALWGAQVCVQNSHYISVVDNYIETQRAVNFTRGSGHGVIGINQESRAPEGEDVGLHHVTVESNTVVMIGRGHNGPDYGVLGWSSYEDFLAAGFEWKGNRYLASTPTELLFSWRRESEWAQFAAYWMSWQEWSMHQDVDSTLRGLSPTQAPPNGVRQAEMMKATTGWDYPEAKLALTVFTSPSQDWDEDGLPDEWERRYFGSVRVAEPGRDDDYDGLTNIEELGHGSSPVLADSDGDGVLDGDEDALGCDATVYDSDLDRDSDGLTVREENEDGTFDTAPESPVGPSENGLSCWISTTSGMLFDPEGRLISWRERSPNRSPIYFGGSPVAGTSAGPGRLVALPAGLVCGGGEGFWGSPESGCTVTFVYQPTVLDEANVHRAILTSEAPAGGFRLFVRSGYIALSAQQSGGSLYLSGHTRLLPDKIYVVSLRLPRGGGGAAIYIDGKLEAETQSGLLRPGDGRLAVGLIGGVAALPARIGDVVVHRRLLSNLEHRAVEVFLRRKFELSESIPGDVDWDGVPNDTETLVGTDPWTPDAVGDEDADSVPNGVEFDVGSNPLVADSDGDGMPDGWEWVNGTRVTVADAADDPDGDGLTNWDEFRGGTDPLQVEAPWTGVEKAARVVWWRAEQGVEMTDGSISAWRDASASANDGVPAAESGPVGSATWAGRSVLQLGATAFRSSSALPAQLDGSGNYVIMMMVRPSNGASLGRIVRCGNLAVDVTSGGVTLVNGGVNATETTGKVIAAEGSALSIVVDRSAQLASLYVDGGLAARLSGTPLDLAGQVLELGGSSHWSGEVAEVIVEPRRVAPGERRMVDEILHAKWTGSGTLLADSDGDALPDWWEIECGADPDVMDSGEDVDWDGLDNATAFQQGLPGFVWLDTDGDGMHDNWEVTHGLNPSLPDDGSDDTDGDGLSNLSEFALASDPRSGSSRGVQEVTVGMEDDAGSFEWTLDDRAWAVRCAPETLADASATWGSVAIRPTVIGREGPRVRMSIPLTPAAEEPETRLYRLRLTHWR